MNPPRDYILTGMAYLLVAFAVACLSGCGGPAQQDAPTPVRPALSCTGRHGEVITVEEGITTTCDVIVTVLGAYRDSYDVAWGPVDTMGWQIRIRAAWPVDQATGGRRSGVTWWGPRLMDIYQGSLYVYPHELHHVALGPPSIDHHGWCPFGAWEQADLGLDEHVYLGCPAF